MLGMLGMVLFSIGLTLCMVVAHDAFRRSWRHGLLVLAGLPIAAPVYLVRAYTGPRFAVGLGMSLTLGLGALLLLAVYFTAMHATSSLRQIAADQGYTLKLRGVAYREGAYIYTLRSPGALHMQGPLLEQHEVMERANSFVTSVLGRFYNERNSSGSALPLRPAAPFFNVELMMPPNAWVGFLVNSNGEAVGNARGAVYDE